MEPDSAEAEPSTPRVIDMPTCSILIAGAMPLRSSAEAVELTETFTDFRIPEAVIERLKAAGNEEAQKKEGVKLCAEIISSIRGMEGLRGIHILSGGNEAVAPEVLTAAGL